MTSEQRAEKKRVEKRLVVAKSLRHKADVEYSAHYEKCDYETYGHKWLILDRRVRRIEQTLRGYD
jgi:hypothetical protein